MSTIRRLFMVVAAVATALVIANLQLAWNMRTPAYLQQVASQSKVNQSIAQLLPDYAASKLPDPVKAKKVFSENITPSVIDATLQPLYQSISNAYIGKTDVVMFSLEPITTPIMASGYAIPPGTIFAQSDVQVNGLAAALRNAARVMVPLALVALFAWLLLLFASIKANPLRSMRNTLMLTALVLAGFAVATLALPTIIQALLKSSALDEGLRQIIEQIVAKLLSDSARYYLVWAGVLVFIALVLSIASGLSNRPKKPKRHKVVPTTPAPKEL